jgi:hypothetical protein
MSHNIRLYATGVNIEYRSTVVTGWIFASFSKYYTIVIPEFGAFRDGILDGFSWIDCDII